MAISVTDLPEKYQRQIMEKMKKKQAGKAADEAKRIADKLRKETDSRASLGRTAGASDPPYGKTQKENKLHAVKTDGYASKREARRAEELRLMQAAGEISNLREQVKFVLIPAKWEEIPRIGKRGKPIRPKRKCVEREIAYIADFVYEKDGKLVVEDAKGYKDPSAATYKVFVMKRKLMNYIYGIEVIEV